MSARRRQSAEDLREMFEERQAVQQHGREHGRYWNLSSPEARLAAALIAAADHQPQRRTVNPWRP